MVDVKKKHRQKVVEEKIQRKLEREEKKYIQSIMEEKKCDWRKELNEQMTTTDVFFTTLPPTGNVDLQAISGGDQNSFDPIYTDGVEFGASGNGSGRMGGFNIGANYLKFSQTPDAYNDRTADTIKVDTSKYTTVTISAIAGNNSNGGVSPTANLSVYWFSATNGGFLGRIPSSGGSLTDYSFTLPAEARGKDIDIYFYEPDVPLQKTQYIGQSIPSLHPSTWNDTVAGYANNILSKSNPTTDDFDVWGGSAWIAMQQQYYGAASAFTWNAPGYPAPVSGSTSGTTQADRIAVGQAIYNAFGNGSSTRYPLTYGITNVGFRRVTPVNVFVPLDSPEATSFIRTEPNLSNLSPEEKNKKLRDMLNASDEYLEKMLGANFPGTGAVPPGEYEVPQPPTWEQAAAQTEIQQTTANIQSSIDNFEKAFSDIKAEITKSTALKSFNNIIQGKETPFVVGYIEGLGSKQSEILKALGPSATSTFNQIQQYKDLNQKLSQSRNPADWDRAVKVSASIQQLYDKFGKEMKGEIGKAVSLPPDLTLNIEKIDKQIADLKAAAKQSAIDARNNELAAWGTGAALIAAATVGIGALIGSTATSSAGGGVAATLRGLKSAADAAKAAASKSASRMGQDVRGRGMGDRWAGSSENYEPQGQVIIEKKLKSPEEVLNKIPGYYDGKPAPLGFPVEQPPKMVNGMHPDLVDGKKTADRFNRMDPESAKAMPLTGNPHIDKKVKAARKKPK